MKVFNASIASIRNSEGVFEPMAALRGLSSYELAVKNGFEGTEAEWMEMMLTDGWVGTCQNLDANKANLTDVFTRDQTVDSDVKTNYGFDANAIITPSQIFTAANQRLNTVESNFLQIYIGQYSGTNGSGINNPTVLNVGLKPLLIWVRKKSDSSTQGGRYGNYGPWMCGQSYGQVGDPFASDDSSIVYISWYDDRVEWYSTDGYGYQLNAADTEYEYAIIGIRIPGVTV